MVKWTNSTDFHSVWTSFQVLAVKAVLALLTTPLQQTNYVDNAT